MVPAGKTKKIFDGRYEILSIVGRGARSVVYHARHATATGQEVALKVLVDQKTHSTTEMPSTERMRREALALVSARHKYVIRLDDFHSMGELCYLSMEFAPESDLRKYMRKMGGKLSCAQAELFLMQCAEALGFIHKAGIIHRDVKPDNILVINEREIRVADFGIAILPGEKLSAEELKAGVGTLTYLPPEALEGAPFTQQGDLYALGISFFEAISGVHPFEKAALMDQLEIRKDNQIPQIKTLVPDMPDHLAVIIMRLLRYNTADRFSSARELVETLRLASKNKDLISAIPASSAPAVTKVSLARTDEKNQEKEEPLPTSEGPETTSAKPTLSIVKGGADELKPSDLEKGSDIHVSMDLDFEEPGIEDTIAMEPLPLQQALNNETSNEDASALSPQALMTAAGGAGGHVRSNTIPLPPRNARASSARTRSKTMQFDKATIDKMRRRVKTTVKVSSTNKQVAQEAVKGKAAVRVASAIALGNLHERAIKLFKENFSKKSTLITLLVGAFLITTFIGKVVAPFMERHFGMSLLGGSISAPAADESSLPSFAGGELSFPNLPIGVYRGTIDGLIPSQTLPLSMISLPEDRGILVIVGLAGWTPVLVHAPSDSSDSSLRVASNGFILDFYAQPINGETTGKFVNKYAEVGSWSLRPVTKEK